MTRTAGKDSNAPAAVLVSATGHSKPCHSGGEDLAHTDPGSSDSQISSSILSRDSKASCTRAAGDQIKRRSTVGARMARLAVVRYLGTNQRDYPPVKVSEGLTMSSNKVKRSRTVVSCWHDHVLLDSDAV